VRELGSGDTPMAGVVHSSVGFASRGWWGGGFDEGGEDNGDWRETVAV
jgi:hypothetical protein